MFEPSEKPRVFACPPGADFPKELVSGLLDRFAGRPPHELARVEIFVNTQRMRRRIFELFDAGPAVLLPRIRLVTDLVNEPVEAELPAAVSPLRRRLELSQLISGLLEKEPDLAPRSALFDLSDSLALFLDEMQDEGVSPERIRSLDVADQSGHWQRSLKFLDIVNRYFDENAKEFPDPVTRQRRVVEWLAAAWGKAPPQHPVVVAGSTGSRGSTALLMQAVARLPQGALVLPGFDFELPDTVWENLQDALTGEDHPQFRFQKIMSMVEISPRDVKTWAPHPTLINRPRNKLVSLALRPAPVTSQWLVEGPELPDLIGATRDVSLIEAPSPRLEALAISVALRKAAEDGIKAALVTPDRVLTRRVQAALDRWRIEPDVSAGDPLDQSPPGRLFRHVADLFGRPLTADALVVILKHPLVNSGNGSRGQHQRWVRELELELRRNGPPFPDEPCLVGWASAAGDSEARLEWVGWIADTLLGLDRIGTRTLEEHLEHQRSVVCSLAAGPTGGDPGELWLGPAGEEMLRAIQELEQEAPYGGQLSPRDHAAFFRAILKRRDVRDPVRPHPNIMIWGTLEARVQGADLIILGGLNEGVWPEALPADPWLNRRMRHAAGLLVPERRIGLSAHDFQQAIAAKQVVLTRCVRDDESETVPSRWLNRLCNLLQGVSQESRRCLAEMRDRGEGWLEIARALEAPAPTEPAPRPSPRPPVSARPDRLSVTAITTLIRDPYAVYARYILGLRPLDPLSREPDAPLRGTVLHKVMEEFVKAADFSQNHGDLRRLLLEIADRVLLAEAPWPAARILWRSKLEKVADVFLRDEIVRQEQAAPVVLEWLGKLSLEKLGFTLTAKADRIDRAEDGRYLIYDYKTGRLPSAAEIEHFDKQLLLEAVMVEAGAFPGVAAGQVRAVAHIGLGANPAVNRIDLEPGETATIRAEFEELISRYQKPGQGYMARRAVFKRRFGGDYDHLARFGEWDDTQTPDPQKVGK